MSKFETLAKANLDHYNNHPVQHNLLTIGYAVVAIVAVKKFARRITKDDHILRSGMMA